MLSYCVILIGVFLAGVRIIVVGFQKNDWMTVARTAELCTMDREVGDWRLIPYRLEDAIDGRRA